MKELIEELIAIMTDTDKIANYVGDNTYEINGLIIRTEAYPVIGKSSLIVEHSDSGLIVPVEICQRLFDAYEIMVANHEDDLVNQYESKAQEMLSRIKGQ